VQTKKQKNNKDLATRPEVRVVVETLFFVVVVVFGFCFCLFFGLDQS